jgi:hypothetical protein
MNIATPLSGFTPHIRFPSAPRSPSRAPPRRLRLPSRPGQHAAHPDCELRTVSGPALGVETLEYTGTGRELLIGFMIALAVLVPVYVTYCVLGIAAEQWRRSRACR